MIETLVSAPALAGAAASGLSAAEPADPQLVFFGQDPWWVVVIKVLLAFVLLLLLTLFNIWLERRVVARMQHRVGPNINGPFGLLQSLADGVKLIAKEDLMPKAVDKAVYIVAPLIAIITCFLAIAVMPFGPVVEVPFNDVTTPLQVTDLPVAVLFVLAIASIEIYGIVLAGWSSGSTYPLLGAVRSSAQMVSYEVAMGLSLVTVFLYAGTMSTSGIVGAQEDLWFGITLLPSFIIYMISMVGETNRTPFDLPEGEGEIVGGFHTEYSSFKFAAFFLAEYINMVTVSMLATTMFLGGWRAPFPLSLWDGANEGYWPALWFLGKVMFFMFLFIWLRGTLPRFRYDQFMKLGWKVLIPASLAWIVAVGTMNAFEDQISDIPQQWLLIGGGVFVVIFLALGFLGGDQEDEPEPAAARQGHVNEDGTTDPLGGGYPVPPMPGKEKSTHG